MLSKKFLILFGIKKNYNKTIQLYYITIESPDGATFKF